MTGIRNTSHHILHPGTRDSSSLGARPSSRTGRSKGCSDVHYIAAVVSSLGRHMKTWRHSQNRKYITYCKPPKEDLGCSIWRRPFAWTQAERYRLHLIVNRLVDCLLYARPDCTHTLLRLFFQKFQKSFKVVLVYPFVADSFTNLLASKLILIFFK